MNLRLLFVCSKSFGRNELHDAWLGHADARQVSDLPVTEPNFPQQAFDLLLRS